MANQHTKKKEAERKKAADETAKKQQRDQSAAIAADLSIAEQFKALKPGKYIMEKVDGIFGAAFSVEPDKHVSSCDAKAKRQPHFTLLAQDNFTPVVLAEWISLARAKGIPDQKLFEAEVLLRNIEKWRTENPLACKAPD